MRIDTEIRSLQNFADKFNLTVKYFQYEDLRRKTKFIFTKDNKVVSKPMTYEEGNHFLLGIYSAQKHQLLISKIDFKIPQL